MTLPDQLKKALAQTRRKLISKGQILFYEGDTTSEVMIIKSGIIKVHDIDDQGNEKVLHLLKSPAVFPLAFFTGGNTPTRWYYTALTDCELYVMLKDDLHQLFYNHPELAEYLMHWFSREVHEILTRLSSLGKTVTKDKIVAALKFLGVWHSLDRPLGWKRVTFPVSHQLLADMTGITRESVTLTMKELHDDRLVRTPRVTVLEINFQKLCSEAE